MEKTTRADDDAPLEALGDGDWRVRRRAVGQIVERAATDDDVRRLLAVLRDFHRDFSRLNAAIQVLVQTGADVVPSLARLLAEPDSELRCYVALTLGERGDPRAIPALLPLLSDGNVNVVVHAMEALGRLRAGAAADALLKIVESRDFAVSYPALVALGEIGDERAAAAAMAVLNDSLLQTAAVEALTHVGDVAAVRPLTRLLAEPATPTAAIARALTDIHAREERRFAAGADAVAEIRRTLSDDGKSAVLNAFTAVSTGERLELVRFLGLIPIAGADVVLAPLLSQPELRAAVAVALQFQPASAGDPLGTALLEADADAICVGCDLLGKRGDRAAVPTLVALLHAEEPAVIVAAIEALAKIGDLAAYPELRSLLGHPDKSIRHASVVAISQLRPPTAAAEASALLSDASPHLREAAVKVLGHIDAKKHLPEILAAGNDADERVCRAAIEQLPLVNDDAVTKLIRRSLQSDRSIVRAAAAGHLASRPFATVAAELGSLVGDADAWVSYLALGAVLKHDPNLVTNDTLERLATQPDGAQVRVLSIAELGRRGVVPQTLIVLTTDAEADVVRAAITALGQSPDSRAAATLAALLHDHDPAIRRQATQALPILPHRDAVAQLRDAAFDRDSQVAEDALAGLAAIGSTESVAALLNIAAVPGLRNGCIRELSRIDPGILSSAAQGLLTTPIDSRRAIVSVVSHRHSPLGLDLLRAAVRDSEPVVSFAARYAIERLTSRFDGTPPGTEGNR